MYYIQKAIVCTPKHLDSTMTVIRSSLEQLDKITTQNKVLPSIKITPPPPLVPPKSFPPSPQPPFQHPTAFTKVIPSSNKKPTVPPKPRIPSAIIIDTTPITGGSTKIRPAKHTRIQTEQIECEKDNGNDGDDVVIMLDNGNN
jgi:hypothetical protein